MGRRDTRQEDYEEVLFVLLMEKALEMRETQALEELEHLNRSAEYEISSEVEEEIRRFIARQFESMPSVVRGKWIRKTFRRIAIAACLAVIFAATALAISPDLRKNLFYQQITITDKSTNVVFTYGGESELPALVTDDESEELKVGWIPNGFSLERKKRMASSVYYKFCTEGDETLSVEKTTGSSTAFSIDTKDAAISQVPIKGKEAMVFEKRDRILVVWSEEEEETVFCVEGENLSKEDVIRVAKNIQ